MKHFIKLFFIYFATITLCFATSSENIIKKYYAALNNKDMKAYLALMDTNVIHDINLGDSETGIDKLKVYVQKDLDSFDEKLSDIIIMTTPDGTHAAAEWIDNGTYYKNYPGFPIKARGQHYTIRGGQFFEIHKGKITRITTYFDTAGFFKQIK